MSTFGSIDGTASYGYDKTSQLISVSYAAAAGHTEPPNFAIAFDSNGNRSSANGASTTISTNNEVTNDVIGRIKSSQSWAELSSRA